jgi:hypothetical protein
MKKTVLTLSVFITFLMSSCEKEAISSEQKGDFKVEFLFEKNGCKMYRFRDNGRAIYWSDCEGKTYQNYTENSGKSSHTVIKEVITTKNK